VGEYSGKDLHHQLEQQPREVHQGPRGTPASSGSIAASSVHPASATQVFSRDGSALNQFVNPIGPGNIGWKFYILYVLRCPLPRRWTGEKQVMTDIFSRFGLAVETSIIFFAYPAPKRPTVEELAKCESYFPRDNEAVLAGL
jgi:hypothetical protein